MPITINDCKCGSKPEVIKISTGDCDTTCEHDCKLWAIRCDYAYCETTGVFNHVEFEELVKTWNELNPQEVKDADTDHHQ